MFSPMGMGVMGVFPGQYEEEADEPSLPFLSPSMITLEATYRRGKELGVWKAAPHFH